MSISVVRLGEPRAPNEGTRLGTVRRPPRGVRKEELSRRDFYDVWMPELAPSAELLSWFKAAPVTPARWSAFSRRYRVEMKTPASAHLITLLAALSTDTDLAVGCYCQDEAHCHRSL